jgi:sugar/nucleoside kinase (ribokinase family)
VQPVAVIGSLCRDFVADAPPRPGGAVLYAARILRALGSRAVIVTKCAAEHRSDMLPRLVEAGLPVSWRPAATTTEFSFAYDGERRTMRVDAVGEPWAADAGLERLLAGIRWLHVGALLRSDFPPEVLGRLARGRVLSLDGQALVRPGRVGPLELDGEFDPQLLAHVTILKLSEDETRAVVGQIATDRIAELGVPEVVVTLGAQGALVFAGGRSERVAVDAVAGVDPTGAGDSFAAAYLAARSSGDAPVGAARRACSAVAALLQGRV